MITNTSSKQVRLFLLALTLMILFGCAATTPNQTMQDTVVLQQQAIQVETLPTKTYVNTKYSFTFTYPRIFERTKDYQDGDGMYFMSDEASLLIWGTPVDIKSPNQNSFQPMNVGENEEIVDNSYTIQTFTKHDLSYCFGTKYKNKVMIQVQLTYPKDSEEQYKDIVDLLINEIADNK